MNQRWLFRAKVFFWGSAASKDRDLGIKTITDNFTQWPKQRWCKVIIVIKICYSWHFCRHFKSIFSIKMLLNMLLIICVLIPLWSFRSIHTYVQCAVWQMRLYAMQWHLLPRLFGVKYAGSLSEVTRVGILARLRVTDPLFLPWTHKFHLKLIHNQVKISHGKSLTMPHFCPPNHQNKELHVLN